MRSRATAAYVCAVLALAASVSVLAAGEKGDMRGQLGVLLNAPTDDLSEPGETIEATSAFGVQLSFEYMVTDMIGIEPGLGFATHDVEVDPDNPMLSTEELGEIDFTALTANVNFHVMSGDNFDLFLGPTVGYVFWGDLESDLFMISFSTEDDFLYGVNVGLDFPLTDKWGFAASIGYLLSDVGFESSEGPFGTDLGVDPLQLKFGASLRF